MRIAVLVKQIPAFEEMELGPDGRLRRDGVDLEMNPYCRRAVSKGVELAEERPGSHVTVITLGPPTADDTLREAIAWGLARHVDIEGLHVTDPAFAGSDTLATAKALAAALRADGPFDLILTGRNSVDADTGQVGAEVAALLDLPLMTGVRELTIDGDGPDARVTLTCEHDDGRLEAELTLPAVLSCAERLCEPTKVDPPERAAVPASRVRRVDASALGPGPWGQDGSPTWVGPVKVHTVERARRRWPEEPVAQQVARTIALLRERGALTSTHDAQAATDTVATTRPDGPLVVVVVEPDRAHATRELLGAAAALTGQVLAITVGPSHPHVLASWGADRVVELTGDNIEEDVAAAVADVLAGERPWAVLVTSTAWGREVASRLAVQFDAGLVGDAVELEVDEGRLVAWKPAFGGQLMAAIGYTSAIQMATVRAGVLPSRAPRPADVDLAPETRALLPRSRVQLHARTRDDDLDVLAEAEVVLGVGTGVHPDEYAQLEPLRRLLGAELGATRKVTDKGWMPRARQIGITGRAIAPRLFISLGASGKFNHAVGVRAAGTVVAINPDPDAPIWHAADAGIVADWHVAVPLLVDALAAERSR